MWVWLTRVRSHSMAPTLTAKSLFPTYSLRRSVAIRRGDIVVFDSAEVGSRLVKRVIGLPGEGVTFVDGRVHIDGAPLDEPYASRSLLNADYRVPEGHYFLLGDNRDGSIDSRSWARPFIERRAIKGRLWLPRRHRRIRLAHSPRHR